MTINRLCMYIHVHVPASFIVSCIHVHIIKSVMYIEYTAYDVYIIPTSHLFQCKELFGRGVKPKSNQLVKVNTNIHFTIKV